MEARIILADNLDRRSIELFAELDPGDFDLINRIGERVAEGTGWDVTVLAVEVGT